MAMNSCLGNTMYPKCFALNETDQGEKWGCEYCRFVVCKSCAQASMFLDQKMKEEIQMLSKIFPAPQKASSLSVVVNEKNFGIPLQKLSVTGTITDSIAQIEFSQTFKNDSEFSIESSFTFPSDPEIVISKMTVKIGERLIETKVID